MYGRSISALDLDKIIFQCGKIHKEIPYNQNKIYGNFSNKGIGYNINIDEKAIAKCIKENSNTPYWNTYKYISETDLRSPQNKEILIKILKELKLDDLIKLY